ncbi:CHK domain-containing protein [Aphelenchoides fujianensis]|nr:CHK domain-containing protein [Aphelenchoides fujianensis]
MQLTDVELDAPIEPTSVPLRWVLEGLDAAKYARWDELRRSSSPAGVSCTPISGAGFLSDVLRVRIRFEDGQEFGVILKAPTTEKLAAFSAAPLGNEESWEGALIANYHNAEIRFYEQFGRAFGGFPLPRLLAAERSSLRPVRHGQLLLEDVGHLGAIADNRRGLNFEQCKGVMHALADFHTFTLLLPDSQKVIETLQNEMDDYNEEKWRLSENLQKLDPFFVEHKAEIDRLIRENHAQVRDPHLLFGIPPVLAHGDVWTNNIFFKRRPDGAAGDKFATLLDWQCPYPGTGLEDCAHFLCTSADADTLRNHEDDLLRVYCEEINRRLMLEIYRFHRRHEILFATFILGIGTTKNATDEERRAAVERLRISYERVLPELDADGQPNGGTNGLAT